MKHEQTPDHILSSSITLKKNLHLYECEQWLQSADDVWYHQAIWCPLTQWHDESGPRALSSIIQSLSVRLNGNICDHSLVHQEVPWVRSLHHLPGKERERVRMWSKRWMIMEAGESEDVCVRACWMELEIIGRHKGRAGEEGIRLHQLWVMRMGEEEIRSR